MLQKPADGTLRGDDHEGIAALLNPRSIAVVGASARADSLGGRPIANLDFQGYTGKVFPINPRYQSIGERQCYPDLLALPERPDVVLVVVGADRIFPSLDEAAQIGAKAAIVFGAGFAEASRAGADRQSVLKAYAAKGLRICGPNCNGVFNVLGRVAMGFSPAFELPARRGPIALISQSGAIGTAISSRGMELGVGFSHVVATGNEADLEVSDFVEHLLDDDDVGVFALFIEGLKDPPRFFRAAEAALRKGKPIIALKVGRSATGARVALSHTGSMTGSYEVLSGALRQKGVLVADGLDEIYGLASLLATGKRPRGGGVAVTSLSGGMAALLADQCEHSRVALAEFAPATREVLKSTLPDFVNIANPLDVTGHVVDRPEHWEQSLRAISTDPGVDVVLSILSILASQVDHRLAGDVVAAAEGDALQVAVWASAMPHGSGMDVLREAGLPTFFRSEDAVRALALWRQYWLTRERRLAAFSEAAVPSVGLIASPQRPQDSAWALLEEAGITIARQILAPNKDALGAALKGLRYPLALKIQSDAIPHKTEMNLLRLNVASPDEAVHAFDELTAIVAERLPDTAIEGVLAQEMIRGRRELILGAKHEPGVGPAIVLGLGGIFSEVLRDISIRVAPLSHFDVHEMIEELKGRDLFGSARGLAPVRRDVIADTVVRFSQLVCRHAGSVAELEINPLILSDDGNSCTAVDVLMRRHTAPEA